MSEVEGGEIEEGIVHIQEELVGQAARRPDEAEIARQAAHRLNLMDSLMEMMPVGIILADADGRIVHGNSRVEEMLRHPVLHSKDADSYGEWISFHADGRQVQSHEYPLSQVIRDGADHAEIEVHYQRGDGTRFWLRVIGAPVLGEGGERIGATVALVDIDEEKRLRDAQQILIAELNHRVKNAFSVVKSIVGQSLRGDDIPDGLRRTLDDRLDAYATAHAKLIGTTWDRAPIEEIARDITGQVGGERIRLGGPKVEVPSRQALAFSMAFYELATNAIKYGALSVLDGAVDLTWTPERDGTRLVLLWRERGGPPPVEPTSKGFGSFIIGRALRAETGGEVTVDYPAEGFVWRLDMPIDAIEDER